MSGFIVALSLFLSVALWLYRRHFRSGAVDTVLVFPAIWVLVEWCRYVTLSGLPWLYVGSAHLSSPLAGWLPVVGALGTGYWLAFTAAVAVVLIERRSTQWLLLLVLPWFAGRLLSEVDWVIPNGDELKVALLQVNTRREAKWNADSHDQVVNSLEIMTNGVAGVDLLVWSESAVPKTYPELKHWLDDIGRRTQERGATLVAGVRDQRFGDGEWRTYNSAIYFSGNNQVYDKRHLVPFGEFVPLEQWIRGWIPYFDLPNSHSSAGEKIQPPILVGDWSVATAICYELAFANTLYKDLQSADLLLVLSNGNWFGKSLQIWQQYEMLRLRAAENGRPAVQASNDGITAISNHRGEVIAQAEPYISTILEGKVSKVRGRTPFSYWGNYLAVLLCLLTLAAAKKKPSKEGIRSGPKSGFAS